MEKRKAMPSEGYKWVIDYLQSDTGDECTPWPFGRFADGYAAVEAEGKKVRISRYVCQRVYGDPPNASDDAAHNCGNGANGCFNPNHLRWDTRKGNLADKVRHNTHNRGERNPQVKLTEAQAREIKSLKGNGEYHKDIAARYGISRRIVGRIIEGKAWAWLDEK